MSGSINYMKSNFTIHHYNGHKETDCSWHAQGHTKEVEYFGGKKTICVSNNKIKHIHVCHNGLEKELDIPEGHEVYQAIRSEVTFYPNQKKKEKILGRVVGLVKDNKVVEEYFLNDIANEVVGMKL